MQDAVYAYLPLYLTERLGFGQVRRIILHPLCQCVKEYLLSMALRSSHRSLLCTPASKSKLIYRGWRSPPQLWKTVPELYDKIDVENVAAFKAKLKTFLFSKYFHKPLFLTLFFKVF